MPIGYLGTLPVDTLKIDRSFIAGLGQDADADLLVAAIVDLARGLALTIVAEGVEDERQEQALRAMGCEFAQGFLYSPAREPLAFEQSLAALAPIAA